MAKLQKAIMFIKINIWQAFYKLCIVLNLEDLTIFASQFSVYMWKIMPFGLTGGPVSWQRFINDLLWEYLNDFCAAYLDNILIYSTSMKKHQTHVQKILAKFWEAEISADVDRYKFYKTKTKYLSLIISTSGIKIDLAKVDAIKQWYTQPCVWEVRFFIRFCNIYCQIISNFSKIAELLNTLIKKNVKFA